MYKQRKLYIYIKSMCIFYNYPVNRGAIFKNPNFYLKGCDILLVSPSPNQTMMNPK